MATAYTTYAYLAKIADADADWGSEQRPVMDALDWIVAGGSRTFFVSPTLTQANVYPQGVPAAGNRRFFDTIQAAIDEVELNAGTFGIEGGQILVYPGTYAEKLTIRKSVGIHAHYGAGPAYYGGQVEIRGDGTTDAAIEIQQSDGETHYVSMSGLSVDNSANPGASEVTTVPYAIAFKNKEPAHSYLDQNKYRFVDCCFRCQTWGVNSKWERAFDCFAWADISFDRCQFLGMNFAGGSNNGYIRRLFNILGNGITRVVTLTFKNCDFYQDELTGTPPADQTVFYQDDYSSLYLLRSHVSMAAGDALDQSAGTPIQLQEFGFPSGAPWDEAWGQNGFGLSVVVP